MSPSPSPSPSRCSRGLAVAATVLLGGTFCGTVSGAVGASADTAGRVATPAVAVPQPAGTVWALSPGVITGYPRGANGNVAPAVTIGGKRAGIAHSDDLAVTASGALWVTDTTANCLKEYVAGAVGNVAPAAVIRGVKTLLSYPVAIAIDRAGHLWVLNDKPSAGTASINEYAATAHGNVAPILRIVGPKTRLFPASGLAVAPGGHRVWVTHVEAGSNLNAPGVQEFDTARGGNVAAVATIAGPATTLDYPRAVVIDPSGEVIVANQPDSLKVSSVVTYAAGVSGNVAPIRLIAGDPTGLVRPGYLALDATGNIWAPNQTGTAIRRFRGAARGGAAPISLIRGALTGLNQPSAVAVFVTAPTVVRGVAIRHASARVLTVSWTPPAATGGGLLGYTIGIRSSATGPWRTRLLGRSTSFTTAALRRHTHYWVRVAARNEAGSSRQTAPLRTTTR